MSLLLPGFLRWLPLAALPVLFHLFLRLRRRPRVFPSLQFFLAADPHLHARRRIREWLVLALRCAALALLILALARPQWHGSRAGGEVTAVWILDNSASMSAVDREGRTGLQRAQAAARALVEDAQVGRGGLVTTVLDPAIVLPEGLTADRSVLRAGLEAIRPTHAAGRPAVAVRQALGRLAESLAGQAELHVFTDAQATEWSASLDETPVPPHVRLWIHRIGNDAERGGEVALERVVIPRRRPVAGRPWRLEAQLRNFARTPQEVRLNALQDGASEPFRRTVVLPPQGRASQPVVVPLTSGHDVRVRLWLEGDGAATASEAWVATDATTGDPVGLLGDAARFGLLAEALSPGGDAHLSGLRVEFVDVDAFAAGARSAEPMALVAAAGGQCADPKLADALRRSVEAGDTLLVAPAPEGGAVAFPEWCGVRGGAERRSVAGSALTALAPSDTVWEDLRDAAGNVRLPPVKAWRWQPLEIPETATKLLATEEGDIVLAGVPVGRGRVVVSGLAWTPGWSELPRRAAFLAIVQTLALTGQPTVPLVPAGDEAEWRAGLAGLSTGGVVQVVAIAGDTLRAEGRVETLPPPVRAGVYRIQAGASTRLLAVRGDAREADRTALAGRGLPWPATIPGQVRTCRGGVETLAAVRDGRRGRDLFGVLVALAVACALAESRLAQRTAPAAGVRPRETGGTHAS